MRQLINLLLIAFLVSCAAGTRQGLPSAKPLNYQPPKPQSWSLPNGLTVIYMPDDELPTVTGSLYLKTGNLWEKANQTGILAAFGSQMRDGGAGDLSADALDRELESYSIGISAGFGDEYGQVSFNSLSPDFDRAFKIFADVLLRPRFEEARLALWKKQSVEGLRRRKDDAEKVMAVSFTKLIFGNSPYGRVLVESDINKISRAMLLEAQAEYLTPKRAILTVSGRIDRAKLEASVERYLGGWKAESDLRDFTKLPPLEFTPRPAIYFVELPFPQANIAFGEQGAVRLSPDQYSIEIFNQVLGGGFGSRLLQNVREEKGLSYTVEGAISPGPVKGSNYVALQSRGETAGQAVLEAIKTVQSMQTLPVSADEMSRAKGSIENSFVFKFDRPRDIVARSAVLRMLDYPQDYDDTFLEQIRAVSPADIQSISKKYWHVDRLVFIVVGDESAYNSLVRAHASSDLLKNYEIKRAKFDQVLIY